jgi:hypothetical protein
MALKFRRGTTAQQSGSLAFGEPFVNTTLGTLIVGGTDGDIVLSAGGTGSTGNFGPISGSGLDITGNANIAGNLTLGGQLTIGDATSDTVNVVASLSSSLIPQTTNVFDLGSTTKKWNNLYASNANFSGDVNITGSLIVSGSNVEFTRDWPEVGSESHFLRVAPFTSSTGRYYDGIGIGVEHWDDGSGTYEHAIQIHSFDNHDSPNYGAELNVGPYRTHMRVIPSGSVGTLSNISVQELTNGKTQALVYADFVQIGAFAGESIIIGNSGSVVEISGSVSGNITGSIAATNGVVSGSSQVIGILSSLNTYTGSNDTTNTTQNSRLDQLSTASGSAIVRLNVLEVETANLETFSSSALTRLSTLEVETANLETTTASLNISVANLNTTTASLAARIAANEAVSGTFARTNSDNTFSGLQSFNNINVEGTASFAYIQSTTGSSTAIGEEFIILNASTPSSNFAGIKVVDSGSSFTTASFVYDGLNNNWVFEKANVGSSDTSIAIFGPISTGGLGTELGLTQNKLAKAVSSHGHHIADSNITDDGSLITLGSNTTITGTLVASGTTLVSSSAQVIGILSSLNSYTASNDTTNTTQTNRLDQLSTASGSAITRLSTLEVETANLEAFTSSINTTIKTRLNVETVVSGSSQISHDSTTGYSANRHIDHTAVTITAGSGLSGGGDISATRTLSIATGGVTDAMLAGSISNGKLTNSTISGIALGSNLAALTIGTGLSGTSYNGSTGVTIANTGVTSNVAGSGISLSGGTGAVTITNSGVRSIAAGTGVAVSATTGDNCSISIGQSVATSANVQFNSLGIGMAASATAGRIDATNDIVAFSSSDIRFKENIKPIENALDKIRKISGNTYDWKAENKVEHGYEGNDVGVIAQEIEAVLPQLVQTRENGYKAVKYDKLVALLIEGIKDQQLQIEQLRIDLNNCRNKGL